LHRRGEREQGALAAAVTSTFTTGTGADLTPPQVVSVNPPSGATGVGTNVVLQVTFNKPIDPLFVTNSNVYLRTNSNTPVPVTLTVSQDLKSVTIAPTQQLTSATTYILNFYAYDLAGNQLYSNFNFTTQ
jgi:hypothetical protein